MIRTTVDIDVGFLLNVECTLAVDCAESRDVIVPLIERDRSHRSLTDAEQRALDTEIDRATDGSWLTLWELYAIQKLRGWHRVRYGSITVDREALRSVCRVLGDLTCALGSECDETLREIGVEQVRIEEVKDPEWLAPWRGEVLAKMRATGYCGDCLWCQVCHLHDQCFAMLKERCCS